MKRHEALIVGVDYQLKEGHYSFEVVFRDNYKR